MEAFKEGFKMIIEETETPLKIHNAAGIIPIAIENEEIKFLLLKNSLGWEFPKGHVEEGETHLEAAIRETKEETGLTLKNVHPSFKYVLKYFIKKNYSTGEKLRVLEPKTVTYFLGQADSKDVKLSFEHDAYGWFTPSEALSKLFFGSKKYVLKLALHFLNNENK